MDVVYYFNLYWSHGLINLDHCTIVVSTIGIQKPDAVSYCVGLEYQTYLLVGGDGSFECAKRKGSRKIS